MSVYFLQVQPDGPIKIGHTNSHVKLRVCALQASSPYELKWIGFFEGGLEEERAAHAELAQHRLRAEWFHPTPEVLAFVKAKCPVFDEADYLRREFHDDFRQVFRCVPSDVRQDIAEKLGCQYHYLLDWMCARRAIDRQTAKRAADLAKKHLARSSQRVPA